VTRTLERFCVLIPSQSPLLFSEPHLHRSTMHINSLNSRGRTNYQVSRNTSPLPLWLKMLHALRGRI
jgi:hypothetical protein